MYVFSYEEAIEIARENRPDIVIINAGVTQSEGAKLEESLRDAWHISDVPIINIGDDDAERHGRVARK